MKKYKYKGKIIRVKSTMNPVSTIYTSYVGGKKIAVSFVKKNVIDDAKKYIRKNLK